MLFRSLDGQYPRQLAIVKPGPRLRVEPLSIIVTADVTRETAEVSFKKLPVAVIGPSHGHTLPPEVDVRLVCPPDIVRSLRPDQIVPTVEVTSKEPTGSVSLPVVIRMDKCESYVTPREVVTKW